MNLILSIQTSELSFNPAYSKVNFQPHPFTPLLSITHLTSWLLASHELIILTSSFWADTSFKRNKIVNSKSNLPQEITKQVKKIN